MKFRDVTLWRDRYADVETTPATVVVNEGPRCWGRADQKRWGRRVVGWASRFGTVDDVYPLYSIGSGFGLEHAIEAATEGLLQALGEDRFQLDDEAWAFYNAGHLEGIYDVNGWPFIIDDETTFMLVEVTR